MKCQKQSKINKTLQLPQISVTFIYLIHYVLVACHKMTRLNLSINQLIPAETQEFLQSSCNCKRSGYTTLQKLEAAGSLVILFLTFLSATGFNSESEREETIVSDPKTPSTSFKTISAGSMALLSSFLISPMPGLIRSFEAPAREKDLGASLPFERSSFFAFASPSVFEAFLDFQFSGNNVFLLSKKEGGEILGIIL